MATAIGETFGLSPEELEELRLAARLHDVGKLAVPDDVLQQPGPLHPEEWAFIREHTVIGERILAAAPGWPGVGAIVRATHERWDGDGLPGRARRRRDPARRPHHRRLRCVLRHDLAAPLPPADRPRPGARGAPRPRRHAVRPGRRRRVQCDRRAGRQGAAARRRLAASDPLAEPRSRLRPSCAAGRRPGPRTAGARPDAADGAFAWRTSSASTTRARSRSSRDSRARRDRASAASCAGRSAAAASAAAGRARRSCRPGRSATCPACPCSCRRRPSRRGRRALLRRAPAAPRRSPPASSGRDAARRARCAERREPPRGGRPGSSSRSRRSRSRRSAVPRATTVPACSGALSSSFSASRSRPRRRAPRPGRRSRDCRRPSVVSTSSPSPATRRRAATTLASTGCQPFVQKTGCKVHVRTVRSSTELLDAGRPGQLRRRRRLRRRHPGADRRQGGAADRHRSDPGLRDVYPALKTTAAEPRGRPQVVGSPARPRRRPAPLAHRPRPPGAGRSWDVLFDPRYAGRIGLHDEAITLAQTRDPPRLPQPVRARHGAVPQGRPGRRRAERERRRLLAGPDERARRLHGRERDRRRGQRPAGRAAAGRPGARRAPPCRRAGPPARPPG